MDVFTQNCHKNQVRSILNESIHFHCALGFATLTLTYPLDSLVRVSRRVKWVDYVVGGSRGVRRIAQVPSVYNPCLAINDSALVVHPLERRLKPKPLSTHFLPYQQFHILFHSLFKVLFTFPSQYLFAIGLSPVFSFRWSLPPTLSCIPKQLDSLIRQYMENG